VLVAVPIAQAIKRPNDPKSLRVFHPLRAFSHLPSHGGKAWTAAYCPRHGGNSNLYAGGDSRHSQNRRK
jgi:hypothetical protein